MQESLKMPIRQPVSTHGKRLFIARHGETIFNIAGRIQGNAAYTPLTRRGFTQAEAMGEGLKAWLLQQGEQMPPEIRLAASNTDRALQTLAVVSEHLGLDWHSCDADPRLAEVNVGDWAGQWYKDLLAEHGEFVHAEHSLFVKTGAGGESNADIALRLQDWIADQDFTSDMLIISHGITSRILRGLLTGQPDLEDFGAPVMPGLPQGSMVMIRDGVEELIVQGTGMLGRK